MNDKVEKQIFELVQKLKVNDGKEEKYPSPKEPRETMEALVKFGNQSVEPVLELLKDTSKYSCIYAIRVLGKIRDPRVVEPLVNLLDTLGDEDTPEIWEALQKIGLPALEPTLNYLKKAKEANNLSGWYNALEILSGIKNEKSFNALVDALSYKYEDEHGRFLIVETAIEKLVDYDDKRIIEYFEKLLKNAELQDYVADALRDLVRKSILEPYEYRKILIKHGLLTDQYESEFEGFNAEQLKNIKREETIRNEILDSLVKLTDKAVKEAIISSKTCKELEKIIQTLEKQRDFFDKKYKDELTIINWRRMSYLPPREHRSYRGLGESKDKISEKVLEWLQNKDFLITKIPYYNNFFATKGGVEAGKTCLIEIMDTGGRGKWGHVELYLTGKGWTKRNRAVFVNSFWQFVEGVLIEIVGKKKFKVNVLKDCIKCKATYKEDELVNGLCPICRKELTVKS